MPELPEVEMTARLVGAGVAGDRVESAAVRGPGTLKSFEPPLDSLAGRTITGIRRRGKHLIVDFDEGPAVLAHLMSAGRLQLYDKKGSPRDRTVRASLVLQSGRELRFREFGTRQSLWIKLVRDPASDPALAGLGPEAWPETPDLGPLLREPRPLHSLLRDQRVLAGIGRSWADEILHLARLSPFKRADTLDASQAESLAASIAAVMDGAIRHYEGALSLPLPDRFPMPLRVHGRGGEPCGRCGSRIEAVHFEDHTIAYCPACQTGGKLLKDRRLSRLLR